MLRQALSRSPRAFQRQLQPCQRRAYRDTRGREIEPLRILYCGSDNFSLECLRRLAEVHRESSAFVESIDVVCKTPKRYGRGLKNVYESPVRAFAEDARLNVHPIATFTRWQPPAPNGKHINLIIAVSFGLFVPPRILNTAAYGGLNVHPSLLPSLRGPAPLHHTLIHDLTHTGVSLCTLDHERFDHGTVLRQHDLQVPNSSMANYDALSRFMAPHGAELLIEGLRDGCFLAPLNPVQTEFDESHAPKLTADDASIRWTECSAEEILRLQKAVPSLRTHWLNPDGTSTRVRLQGLRIAGTVKSRTRDPGSTLLEPGLPRVYWMREPDVWISWRVPSRNGIRPTDDEKPVAVDVSAAGPELSESPAVKSGRPLVGGIWTKDGVFLTFDTMTLDGRANNLTKGSVASVNRLYAINGQRYAVLQ